MLARVTCMGRRIQESGAQPSTVIQRKGRANKAGDARSQMRVVHRTANWSSACACSTAPDTLTDFPVDGVFIAIGHTPTTDVFAGQGRAATLAGAIPIQLGAYAPVSGVFAAGDVVG